jgi:hypothetical protein
MAQRVVVRRRMRRGVAAVIAVAATAAAGAAGAHVAPARDVNNRYVKLTVLGDRVRLAYTVYYGELPGAVERRRLDADRDGRLTDAETAPLASTLAAAVASRLTLTVDGTALPTRWTATDVGLGTPVVAAGSFAVDLIAWYCLPAGERHSLHLIDTHEVPRPGETELIIEDSPGLHIDVARLGEVDLPDRSAQWEGAGGPLATDGLTLTIRASPSAARPRDGTCPAPVPGTSRRWLVPALAAAALAAAALGAWHRRRRR